jgi:hypothetical protein
MKPWKAALGVGAACAVCCAVPLLGGAAALTLGTATLAAMGSVVLACADELAPLAIGLLALMGGAVVLWRWRSRPAPEVGATKPCGCAPGACG